MVAKVEEMVKRSRQQGGGGTAAATQNQMQKQVVIQCNKGKVNKFKRSTSNLEEDGLSSAIFLLACIACNPSYL